MREFIDVTGRTENEAIQNALEQLHLERDDVSVEVLERAKSGFLGLGSSPAKVRVSYGDGVAETEPEKAEMPEKPVFEKLREPVKQRPGNRETEKEEARVKRDAAEKQAISAEKPASPAEETTAVFSDEEEVDDEKAQQIKTFLTGLLLQMESEAAVRVYLPEKGRYKVILDGQNLGALIGRRGETLDAIQQLTSYCVNRTGGRVRIQLDAENYRAKREQSLEHLAKKVAAKVTKYHRSVTLEPMNAYERHVIHAALQDEPGVTTYSTGVDPTRRVIVAYSRDTAQ